MDFPIEYFRPEVRDGFYVDGMMKRAWAAQIQVLSEVFDNVCKKYNIPYYAHGGTLLGAVRHKGYIPWDDDIDVIMLRDDYIRFKKIMRDAFPEGYEILAYDSADSLQRNDDTMVRVINSGDVSVNPGFLDRNFQFPYPVGIDIFPIDFIPDDPEEREVYKTICQAIYSAASMLDRLDDPDDIEAQAIKDKVTELTGYKYKDNISCKLQTISLVEAVCNMYHRDECSNVVMTVYWMENRAHVYEKEWFENPKQLSFENIEINVCGNPDGELKQEYGPDYMVQNRNFPAHDYPFFGKLEKDLIKLFGKDPFYYHFKEQEEYMRATSVKKDNKNIYFIVPYVDDWKYMEFYYNHMIEQGANITVIPIPYYDCDLLKNPVQENYEYNKFPQNLPLADYRQLDLEKEHPDEIVISFPYDQYNYTVMINEMYFAATLRNQTDKLIYITPIETDDTQAMSQRDQIAMRHYVTVPGVVLSDEVFVQSEAMKQAYITRLISSYKEDCEKENADNDKENKLKEIFTKKIKIKG